MSDEHQECKVKALLPPPCTHTMGLSRLSMFSFFVFCMFLDGVCMCLCDYVTGEGDAEKK